VKLAVDGINLLADTRGMGRYVRRALLRLNARPDIELTLLVRDPKNAAAYRAILGESVSVEPLARAAKRKRFDVVWYPWNSIRFPAKAPSLVTINDDFAFRFPTSGMVARRKEQRPIQAAVKDATRIATISNWSRAQLSERFRIDPETIALLPLAPDPFFTIAREAPTSEKPFVLAVGSSEKRKNIDFLRQIVMSAFPNDELEFRVVGSDGEVADDMRLRHLYRTATIVAVPSLAEGYGLVAAEAQACGAAVIAASTSAIGEATGDAAVLLDPAYDEAWIDALRAIASDEPLRAKLGARAAARWAFTSRDRLTPALYDLFHDLA